MEILSNQKFFCQKKFPIYFSKLFSNVGNCFWKFPNTKKDIEKKIVRFHPCDCESRKQKFSKISSISGNHVLRNSDQPRRQTKLWSTNIQIFSTVSSFILFFCTALMSEQWEEESNNIITKIELNLLIKLVHNFHISTRILIKKTSKLYGTHEDVWNLLWTKACKKSKTFCCVNGLSEPRTYRQ